MAKKFRGLRPDRGLFPLSELAGRSARDFGDKTVMRAWDGSGWREVSYEAFAEQVHRIARWLIDQGLERGDRVALLSENRPEWGAVYLGVQTAGGVIVPVDRMMPAAGVRHVLSDSGARLLFASRRSLESIEELEPIATLERTICLDEETPEGSMPLAGVLAAGAESAAKPPERSLEENAAILYTSGTTGHSKGVVLTQRNIMSDVAACSRVLDLGPEDTYLSVLPLHHTYECTAGFLLPVYLGCAITYSRGLASAELLADMRETNVTLMICVPLFFEKMRQGILRKARQQGKERLIRAMLGVVAAGEVFGLNLGKSLFRGLRERAGMGTVRYFITGGGPVDPEISHFFARLGITMLQGFGLTETSPVTHMTPPWRVRHGTVGRLLPGMEHKLVDVNEEGIGEVCIRGPNVFKEYYRNEKATREAKDEEGWLHTGDLGVILPDGNLRIAGRKKNVIVTGGGKNVYPEEVEHFLNRSRFIAESLVHGIPRDSGYGEEVAALIYPDYEQLDLHFEEVGVKPTGDDVQTLIKSEIHDAQRDLEEFKHVRRFRLVEEEFQKTTTRKIKRFLYEGEMTAVNGARV